MRCQTECTRHHIILISFPGLVGTNGEKKLAENVTNHITALNKYSTLNSMSEQLELQQVAEDFFS